MIQLTDEAIILKIKEGDNTAFHWLFQKYFQPLFLFSCKFVDEDTAKDLVQDCFLELWKNRKKVTITSSFSAWIFTVVKNKCFRHLKKEIKKNSDQNDYYQKLKEEELIFFIHSEKSILEFEVKDRMQRFFERLPAKCNQIFNESRINDLTNKDIAAKYDISVKAVEKHISKALKLFKEEFQDYLIVLIFFILPGMFNSWLF